MAEVAQRPSAEMGLSGPDAFTIPLPESRPTSSRPESARNAFQEISLVDNSGSQRSSTSTSEQWQSGSQPEEAEEIPPSPIDSGSDYSEPSTPKTSRPVSMDPSANGEGVEVTKTPKATTQTDDNGTPTKKPSQQWSSLTQKRTSEQSNLKVDAFPPRAQSMRGSGQYTFPSITVSPEMQSPEGSNYSGSPPQSPRSPSTPTVPVSPMTPEEAHMSMDSLQSIALSELSQEDYESVSAEQMGDVLSTPRVSGARHMRKPSSLEILQNNWGPPSRQSTLFDMTKDEPLGSPREGPEESEDDLDTTAVWRTESSSSLATPRRDSDSSLSDVVDWSALDKTEEQEKEDKDIPEGAEDESTAFLLARLEQENAKFSADPKSTVNKNIARVRSKSRPPSMAQLKKLVSQQDTPSIRYSLTPAMQQQTLPEDPPPMTELEFWAALVQDYPSTASRLPTLTTTKIRAGIPPPLRGVVWTSMAGARDKSLEESFEKLQNEPSPHEGIINKDVGRSFPGVELFRDADGEGQRMLGRVLKSFSLHDKDVGYCQGLGFLVGPLLMNMGEKDAFCVLVRLMDHYALRPSFLPSLSGLHMRIFQFSTLLAQHHPELSEHLTGLGVEPAYLSQWFLSCFAVTCPLPMLFRIYDVIFAEGANETVMRVALALFRRNEQKMLESTEFEEVMQLLLGRAIWDAYGCNPDELVDDFTSLGNIITHQRLQELEKEFESKDGETVGQSAGFLPDVQAAAGRFLGRLWAPNHAHTPSKSAASTLSPASADKEPPSGGLLSRFPRRTASKANIVLHEPSSGSEGSNSTGSVASTAPTDSEVHDAAALDSQADSASVKGSLRTVSVSTSQAHLQSLPGVKEQQELHSQIEDLLMALSEMQREHAQMAAMLQKEREERTDDHRAVRQLVANLQKSGIRGTESKRGRRSMPPPSRRAVVESAATKTEDKRRTLPPRPRPTLKEMPTLDTKPKEPEKEPDNGRLDALIEDVQSRLDSNARFSASFETRAQLRSNLARTREQLVAAESQIKDLSERAEFSETSLMTFQNESESLRSEVEELRARVNDDFKEKQKLELTVQNMEIQMRMEAKAIEKKNQNARAGWMQRAESSGEVPTLKNVSTPTRSRENSISSAPGNPGGLRELKLGRRDSVGSIQSIRSTKSGRVNSGQWPQSPPAVSVSASPPVGEVIEVTAPSPDVPVAASVPPPSPKAAPAAPATPGTATPTHKPSASLSVPKPAGFHPRTSSLATKEVFASPTHEVVPDEALLLELVNAKTSEAQARAEVDQLRRSLQVQKRKADEALLQAQAEAASSKLELDTAKAEAEKAKEEAKAARAEVFDASPMSSSITTPITPGHFSTTPIQEEAEEGGESPASAGGATSVPAVATPAPKKDHKKAESTTAPTSGGGWFWQRRTASTNKAVVEEK